MTPVIIFDGTSYFVDELLMAWDLMDDDDSISIHSRPSSFEEAELECDRLNDEAQD